MERIPVFFWKGKFFKCNGVNSVLINGLIFKGL